MGCRTGDMREKAVISVCDGRCLGSICDYEIDPCCGKIEAIFVSGTSGRFFAGRGGEVRIPWDKIQQIGADAILVDVPADSGNSCECCDRPGSKKHWWM